MAKKEDKKAVAKPKQVKPKVKKPKAIPPCPPNNETDGDKTPEVMAWYKEYQPEVYKVKYHALELAKEGRLKQGE